MARSKPNYKPKDPAANAAAATASDAVEKAEEKTKHDDAVKWFTDVLGFPEKTAEAPYTNQMLTDENLLCTLTDKTVESVCGAVRKPGGASKGDPTPILAIEHLKLAVFCLNLYDWTDCELPEMTILDRGDLLSVEDQKRIKDDYSSSKDPGPEL